MDQRLLALKRVHYLVFGARPPSLSLTGVCSPKSTAWFFGGAGLGCPLLIATTLPHDCCAPSSVDIALLAPRPRVNSTACKSHSRERVILFDLVTQLCSIFMFACTHTWTCLVFTLLRTGGRHTARRVMNGIPQVTLIYFANICLFSLHAVRGAQGPEIC